MKNPEIAIVIPAYKSEFLSITLDSIANQTCKDFIVYIGDDCSPNNIKQVTEKYSGKIKIVYHRFETNLGKSDLAAHWDRCIELSNEPYIMFFSDDDVMPDDAIERLYAAIRNNPGHEFFRFQQVWIDHNGKFMHGNPEFTSDISSAEEVLCDKMSCKTSSTACEYAFSRKLYDICGKFTKLPLAYCTDDATWYSFGKVNGTVNIKGKPMMWRNGNGANISTSTKFNSEKLKSVRLFVHWLNKNYREKKSPVFRKSLKIYINTILTESLGLDYTSTDLLKLCCELFRISPAISLSIMNKYLIHRRKVMLKRSQHLA